MAAPNRSGVTSERCSSAISSPAAAGNPAVPAASRNASNGCPLERLLEHVLALKARQPAPP